MIELSHRIAHLLFVLQRFGNRVMPRAVGVRVHGTPITVFIDARILHTKAAIVRDLSGVQSSYAFAAVCLYVPNLWAIVVLGTTQNSTDDN